MGRRGRLFLTGLMLVTFLLQSYLTQTHIHFLREASAISAALGEDGAAASNSQAPKKNTPAPDNPDTCPLCQLLYGGQYVAPNSLVFFLPMAAVSTIEIALGVLPHYDAVSHSWRGRAPPIA
jgi:hypothetical protein